MNDTPSIIRNPSITITPVFGGFIIEADSAPFQDPARITPGEHASTRVKLVVSSLQGVFDLLSQTCDHYGRAYKTLPPQLNHQ